MPFFFPCSFPLIYHYSPKERKFVLLYLRETGVVRSENTFDDVNSIVLFSLGYVRIGLLFGNRWKHGFFFSFVF